MGINFETIANVASLRAQDLLREWYPNGKVRGHEFVVGDPEGNAGSSMSINLTKAFGKDFSTGEKFGDLIDVYAARFGVDKGTAARELAKKLGIAAETGAKPVKQQRTKQIVLAAPPSPETWREAWAINKLEMPPKDVSLDASMFAIPNRGIPDNVYAYRDEQGDAKWVVTRWNADENENHSKLFMPWIWSDDMWIRKGTPQPRMLYGLEQLNRFKPHKKVVICEGEKAAEAARVLLPENPVLSWPNGASSVKAADWSILKDREVIVWPDNDAAGWAALNEIGAILTPIIKNDLRYIDVHNKPHGWDAADAGNVTPKEIFDWIKGATKVWEPPKKKEEKPVTPEIEISDATSREQMWETLGLERKGNRNPHASMDNAVRILTARIPEGDIHYDSFLNQIRFNTPEGFVKLQDHHLITLTLMMQRDLGLQDMRKATVSEAVMFYARTRVRNCLREWLESLEWDTIPRVESVLSEGFGAKDSEYSRAVGRCFLIGLVARAMRPGCQLDSLPILEGEQGIGKSRGLEALASPEFYADIDSVIGTKEFAEQIQGKWLVELSELSSMRPSEVEKIKSGITRTIDVYREPFAVLASDHPRQCVFAGTTNAHQYLMDDSGNRRFWPVRAGKINRTWLRDNRSQLFAEALNLFQHGIPWWDVPEALAKKETSERMFVDGLVDRVMDYCEKTSGDIRISDMLQDWQVPEGQWHQQIQKRVATALRQIGYHAIKTNGKQVYRAPDAHAVIPLRAIRKL